MVRFKKYVSVSYDPLSITTSQCGACSVVTLIAWTRPLLFGGQCPMGVRPALTQIKKRRQRHIEDRNDISNSCHGRQPHKSSTSRTRPMVKVAEKSRMFRGGSIFRLTRRGGSSMPPAGSVGSA